MEPVRRAIMTKKKNTFTPTARAGDGEDTSADALVKKKRALKNDQDVKAKVSAPAPKKED